MTWTLGQQVAPWLILWTAIAGCGSGDGIRSANTSARSIEDIPVLSTFAYDCDDGTTVVANHEGTTHVWLFLPAVTLKLPRLPSASGTKFGDETVVWWTKDPAATLERAGSPVIHCREQRRRSIIEDAKLRGADYWAAGNEPGWTLEIAPDSIRFVTGYATAHYRFATPAPTVDTTGRTVWDAKASDHTLRIGVAAIDCRDSMSGEAFAGIVTLVFDGQEFVGCGTALH